MIISNRAFICHENISGGFFNKGLGKTSPSAFLVAKVDYIFISKNIDIKRCWLSGYIEELAHRAVIVEIELKPD